MRTAAARSVPLLAALAAFGCSTTYDASELVSNPREFFNLASPVVLAAAQVDGQRVTLKRGQALLVTLDEDVAAGLRWEMQRYDGPVVIAPVRHDFTARPGADPALPAGPGEATFRLRGAASGTQAVLIEYKRAFETTAAQTLRFDVVVP